MKKIIMMAVLLSSSSVFANNVGVSMGSSATIDRSCVLSTPPDVNFGVMNGQGRVLSSFNLDVICTSGTSYVLTGQMPLKGNSLSLDKKYYHVFAFKMYRNGIKDDSNFVVFTPYIDAIANNRDVYFGNGGLSDINIQTTAIEGIGKNAKESHKVDIELATYDPAYPTFRPLPQSGVYSASYSVTINY